MSSDRIAEIRADLRRPMERHELISVISELLAEVERLKAATPIVAKNAYEEGWEDGDRHGEYRFTDDPRARGMEADWRVSNTHDAQETDK